jgi:hypothetical protein
MRRVFIISLFFIFSILAGCTDYAQLLESYTGDIVMGYPCMNDERPNKGIAIYTPKDNNFIYLARERNYSDVSFAENKEKVLGINGEYSIVEYEIKTNRTIPVFNGNAQDHVPYTNVKYIPKTDDISFMSYPNLYILNRKTGEKVFITETSGDYSWSKDGKKLYYSSVQGKIYCMDMKTKESEPVYDGYEPQLSASNNYIAFETEKGIRKRKITVKEIATGKEWKYKTGWIDYYKFSPDDQHLAIIQQHTSWRYVYGKELMGWDFKKNQKMKLIEHINDGSYSNFDWK